jgi:signal transduction histidine kinase
VEKKIRVGVSLPDNPLYTFAGEDAITQVVYNLVDNAVKFCPEGGLLLLGLTTDEQKILLTVENDGPTIPPEELACLFDRFHKTDKSRSRDKEGWGLGLAIAKSILVSHGEEIRVRSQNNKTAFTITLPLAE